MVNFFKNLSFFRLEEKFEFMNYRWRGLFFRLSETLNLHYYKQFEYHIWLSYLLLEIWRRRGF